MNNAGFSKTSHKLLFFLLKQISALPFSVLYGFSTFLFWVLYSVTGYRKKVVSQNLERAFPEKSEAEREQIAKQFYRNLCDIIVETLKLATVSRDSLLKRYKVENRHLIDNAVYQGQTVISLGSHIGNWEWGLPGAAAEAPYSIDGIYKPLNNVFFEGFMLYLRGRFGSELIPMKDTLRNFLRKKDQPRTVAMLSDQIPPRGEIQYRTTFLHQDTAFYVGVDKLVAKFKYPVVFLRMRRVKRGYYQVVVEELEYTEPSPTNPYPLTEAYARRLEQCIKEEPDNYLWSHRRWKDSKPAESTVELTATT